MCDSKGVIYKGRKNESLQERFATETDKGPRPALDGADAFVGVSVKDGITAEMVARMTKDPIVFGWQTPIQGLAGGYPDKAGCDHGDAGRTTQTRSTTHGFHFSRALDTRATCINEK